MILFVPFSPINRVEFQVETVEFLRLIKESILTDGWSFRFPPCIEENDYAEALNEVWGDDDILIIEHDIVPTLRQWNEILLCGESKFCSWDYEFKGVPSWASITEKERAKGEGHPGGLTEKGYASSDANGVGFGLCRIDREVQTEKVPHVNWKNLAYELAKLLPAAHIHGKDDLVKHNHLGE